MDDGPKLYSTWQQGAEAARNGVPRSSNPYETQDLSAKNWERVLDMRGWDNGWIEARKNYYKSKA
jgi:hypothetical protein